MPLPASPPAMSTVFRADRGSLNPPLAPADRAGRALAHHLSQGRWLYLLLGVSLLLHAWRLGQPAEVAFDESLVGEFASHYLSGTYTFDIHPPHMKLIYALAGWLGGWTATMGFPTVGLPYPDSYYLAMRAVPALCGSLLPLIATGLALELGAARIWALVCGWAVLLDSALMAESRFILNDVPLLFFGSAGWWCLLRWRATRSRLALAGAALLLGLAVGVKWTGVCFIGPALLALLADRAGPSLRQRLVAVAVMAMGALAVQAAGFEIHLSLLTRSGPGDAFMSPAFQKRLQGSAVAGDAGVTALNDVQAIVELNQTMARYASKVAGHPYASPWYSWPVGWRGIYFWTDDAARKQPGSTEQARIYMLPNLLVWWLGTFAIVRLLVLLLPRLLAAGLRRPHAPIGGPELLIAACWLCCLAPFAAIDRPMFMYHYFPALLCSLLAGAVQASAIERPTRIAVVLVAGFAAMFVWMSPLVYGEPLTQSQYGLRMFMKSWP